MLRTSWVAGPAEAAGPVLVSVTDYTSNRLWDMPGIYRAGRRLARHWPSLDGAVGHWLWAEPLQRRSGSVSVWRSKQALRGFVGLPEHVRIMRTYRDRGSIRSTTWTVEDPDLRTVWAQASEFLRQAA
ncbi:hypothetical protein [Amycolatopsis viridis]|uniref:DUF3291 domain-containing protein n=1 Tax=Amycolatopsis viridis TaxID=185678 RepID=A0ABX0SR63_9PSEU|nr:hypothetical protein [Amycolatopsis viridis]NIH79452.1 hypothetical protein [Amycolatopsis viridis]